MIVFSHLNAPSNHGLDQGLYGLSGVGNVPGGLWVVLELEWSPRTPPAEFGRDFLTSLQPHPLIFLFLSLFGSPISILPFFLASAVAYFNHISVFPFFLAVAADALFFFCISDVMNVSLSCCIMIAWQQTSLCNAEHLFGAINKIGVFQQLSTLLQLCVTFYLIEAD